MKNSLKRKLSLLLALILAVSMAIPTGLLASADGEDPVDPPVTGGEGETPDPEEPASTILVDLQGDVTVEVKADTVNGPAGFTGEGAANLFDKDFATKFCGNVSFPCEFTWEMNEAVAIQTIAITSGADNHEYQGRDPHAWTFSGLAEDGETWVDIDTRAGQVNNENSTTKLYTFDNATAYTSYKLTITAGGGLMQFSDVQLGTVKYDEDADTAAKNAAAAFDAKLEAMGVIDDSTYVEATTPALVAELRAEYKAFDGTTQNMVTKIQLLNDAEAYIARLGAVPALNTLIASIKTTMTEWEESGEYDYHLNGDITHAYDLYKSLSDTEKTKITDYDYLATARTTLDDEINNAFEVTVTGWNAIDSATRTPWIISATAEEQAATQEAAADELSYQRARLGYMLGAYSGATVSLTADWGNTMVAQFDSKDNDNIGNPWNQAGRQWAVLTIPFAGCAFSSTGYFSLSDTMPALSDAFYYNGKIYQQFLGSLKSYEYQKIELGTTVDMSSQNVYPGFNGASDITKNTFRLAYAKYNQANKWEGKVAGIPQGNVQTAATSLYQEFISGDGIVYIVASAAMVENAVADSAEDGIAFVIEQDVADIIAAQGTDFVTGLEATGAPISEMVDGVQLFENGLISNGAFAAYSDDNQYLLVINQIDALPLVIDATNYETAKVAIEAARAAYDALTVNMNLVTNVDVLTSAEAALKTYEDDIKAAKAVSDAIEGIPNEITLDDEADIVALRAQYDALTDAQKALIKNLNILVWAEGELDYRHAEAVEDLINALPDVDHIKANIDTDKPLVEAASAAFDALTVVQQNLVSGDAYDKLQESLDALDPTILGDVDGDGNVTVSDVVALRKAIMSGTPTDSEKAAGDMDTDGKLTVSDVVALRQLIMRG